MPLKFYAVHLDQLFHHRSEYYTDSCMQDQFKEALEKARNPPGVLKQAEEMKLQPWEPEMEPQLDVGGSQRAVFVQVLHLMPLVFNGMTCKKEVLHQLTVVVWDALRVPFGEAGSMPRVVLKRRPETRLLLVLNSWISFECNHSEVEGHLFMMFSGDYYDLLQSNSQKLESQVEREVEQGVAVTLGRTPEEMAFNQLNVLRAESAANGLFSLCDLAVASLCCEADACHLREVSLMITDDLSLLKNRRQWHFKDAE